MQKTAAKKPTYKTIARKHNELAQLISEHRLVAIEMQADRMSCTATEDIPLYGIAKGQKFDLVRSSYEGFAYIILAGYDGRECGCFGFEMRKSCKHVKACNEAASVQYWARKHETREDAIVVDPVKPVVEAPQFNKPTPRATTYSNRGTLNKSRIVWVDMGNGRTVPM